MLKITYTEINVKNLNGIPIIDILCVGVRMLLHPLSDGPHPQSATTTHILAATVGLCVYVRNILVAQEVTSGDTNRPDE